MIIRNSAITISWHIIYRCVFAWCLWRHHMFPPFWCTGRECELTNFRRAATIDTHRHHPFPPTIHTPIPPLPFVLVRGDTASLHYIFSQSEKVFFNFFFFLGQKTSREYWYFARQGQYYLWRIVRWRQHSELSGVCCCFMKQDHVLCIVTLIHPLGLSG